MLNAKTTAPGLMVRPNSISVFSAQPLAFPPPLPDVLKVWPISDHGNVNEIIGKFGGADQLRNDVNQLQSLLYAA